MSKLWQTPGELIISTPFFKIYCIKWNFDELKKKKKKKKKNPSAWLSLTSKFINVLIPSNIPMCVTGFIHTSRSSISVVILISHASRFRSSALRWRKDCLKVRKCKCTRGKNWGRFCISHGRSGHIGCDDLALFKVQNHTQRLLQYHGNLSWLQHHNCKTFLTQLWNAFY